MKVKVFTAFSGYDSQCLALDRLARDFPGFEYELVGWSEIDKNAIKAHNALYPEHADLNHGDISKVDWAQVPDFDFFTYSFPCGLKGTLVKTCFGYADISDINVGNLVLTHANRYKKVTRVMKRVAPSHYRIKATGCDLRLTAEHPMYVLRDGVEQWVKVKDLETSDKVSFCIPRGNEPSILGKDTLWLLGRYCADGWINPKHHNSVNFGIGRNKAEEFEAHIPDAMKGRFRVYEKSCLEYRIADEDFQMLCMDFGSGARNKKMPEWMLPLRADCIEAFLEGYFAGDGHKRIRNGHTHQMFTTVSKQLFLGIQQLIMKTNGIVCSLSVRKDKRKETFSDTYNGQFCEKTLWQEKRGERIFTPIKSIELIEGDVDVYNLEVEDDNSYTCDNVNVHNCTDISNAGKQAGLSEGAGTRSSLLWECQKAIVAKKPKYLLMENVKALVQKKFMPDFERWQRWLAGQGYTNFWEVLNAKNYGVPQNRERVFMVSILDCTEHYFFPKPFPLDRRLKDVLEEKVEEKYYLRQEQVDRIIAHCDRKVAEGCGFKTNFTPPEGVSGTIKTKEGSREYDTYLQEED